MRTPKVLRLFTLAMIMVATVGSVKNWPLTAEYGFSSVFFFIIASLAFFIPTALVSAELATGWPKRGGVFVWVKEAFGHRTGFLAIWLQWIQNVVWYPTILSFIASTFAYAFDVNLAENKLYTLIASLALFWAVTFANLQGMRVSGWISSLGTIIGSLLPGLLIIALGAAWLFLDKPLEIDLSWKSFFPEMSHFKELAFFTGVILVLMGMEMPATHARDVLEPQKNYPRAILLSVFIILGLSIPGVLAIAMVLPQKDISLLSGSIQAISHFVQAFDLPWLIPIMSILIAVGAVASMSTWLVGPIKGLLAAAESGDLPPKFRKINRHDMPVGLLIFQALIVTVLTSLFVLMPTLNSAFWFISVLVAQLYLVMYLLLFAAALYLRYKKPDVVRTYRVPGKKFGIWLVSGIGILTSLFAMFIGFFPPAQLSIGSPAFFVLFLFLGVILFCLGPSILLLFQKPSWKEPLPHEKNIIQ